MRIPAALAVAALLSACATAGRPAPPAPGYLDAATQAPLTAEVAAPPPVDAGEQAASQALTALEDTDRWWLATAQAHVTPPESASTTPS